MMDYSNTSTFNPSNHCDDMVDLAKQAGEAIMPYWKTDAVKTLKDDGSPVTLADQASEDIIVKGLKNLTPTIPIIAEELAEAGRAPDISNAREYWLVDPLDGTKNFIKGSHDFTINIGLIRDGEPIFGLLYQPTTKILYYGGLEFGAFLNGKSIQCQPYRDEDGLKIISQKNREDIVKKAQRHLKDLKIASLTIAGDSLKFCKIADGSAHLYPRRVPTYEWDTCAAHAILLQAGGDIIDFETGERLQYGKPKHLNGAILTGTNQVLNILNPLPSKRILND